MNDVLTRLKSALKIDSDVELAALMNIKNNVISNWRSRGRVNHQAIITICELYQIDLNWLLKSEDAVTVSEPSAKYGTKDGLPLIPIGALAGMGAGDMSVLTLDTERYFVPEFNNKADYLIRITGTSMSPKYHNGDVVACKIVPISTFIQWGKVYIMDTVQGALVKRVFESQQENFVKVVSDNEKYPAFEMHRDEIRSLAIVVGVIRLE